MLPGGEDPRPVDGPWPQALWPPPRQLSGPWVELRRTEPSDAPALFAALDHDRVWAHVAGRPGSVAEMEQSIRGGEAAGRFMWTVRLGGVVVGRTSYLEVSVPDARLEIGFTTYTPAVWATEVNPACKLLLMEWAFEQGAFGRVQLKTDIRNQRSRAAIERLGAKYEGVLRRYQRRADGSVRDTVVFSVIAEEWPAVRAGLEARLGGA